jgi:RNA polymerase sigma-70 factor, ECF subfamily
LNTASSPWAATAGATREHASVVPPTHSAAARRATELFDQFHEPLLRFLMGLTHHPSEAEDLLQEVFLKLYRELESKRRIRNERGWLFTVANNLAMDFHRRGAESGNCAGINELEDTHRNPEADLIENERAERLRAALESLSPQQRSCLELRAEGLRYREIAAVLGLNISTVRTFIVRAITRLSGGVR